MIRLFAGLGLSLLVFSAAHAQSSDFSGLNKSRAGRMEATIGIHEAFSWDRTGGNGSHIEADSDTGWAFSIGYNYTSHWNLAFSMDFSDANYDAVVVDELNRTQNISHELSSYNGQLNLTYHILEGQFTPFIQAGLGWSDIDTNITDGPPETGCWWDPFWGNYICTSFWNTYDVSEFSYNLGVGLRYDLPNNLFIKASYSNLWMDLGSKDQMFEAARIELGFML